MSRFRKENNLYFNMNRRYKYVHNKIRTSKLSNYKDGFSCGLYMVHKSKKKNLFTILYKYSNTANNGSIYMYYMDRNIYIYNVFDNRNKIYSYCNFGNNGSISGFSLKKSYYV